MSRKKLGLPFGASVLYLHYITCKNSLGVVIENLQTCHPKIAVLDQMKLFINEIKQIGLY